MNYSKRITGLSLLLFVCLISIFILDHYRTSVTFASSRPWVQVWSDEFTGTNGTGMDKSKWNREIGNEDGWGNNELQYYTDRTNNAYKKNGYLVIQANRENYKGAKYTSARLTTANKLDIQYGKIEVRAKVPYGQGVWPAIWMLGSNIDEVSWPASGEIDIMEYIGPPAPNTVFGTIHGSGYSDEKGISASYTSKQRISNQFHTYAIEWEPSVIRWYFNGNLYHTATPTDTRGHSWVFDKPFFLLLNLAIGGDWPGYPNATTPFPQKLLVDYVRVFQR